jgi:hypothetical protein
MQGREGRVRGENTYEEAGPHTLGTAEKTPTTISTSSDTSQGSQNARLAARRALGIGLGRVGNSVVKTAIDLPVAMADGLAAVVSNSPLLLLHASSNVLLTASYSLNYMATKFAT